MEEKKRPKKKKSLSAQIDFLRLKNHELRDYSENLHCKFREFQQKINFFQKILPKKYYRIKFKIMAENELFYEYTEIKESYSTEMAIIEVKTQKLHPSTFELLDITLLGE